jgi:hypothetical protein
MAKKEKAEEYGLPSLALVFGYMAVKELQRIEDRVRVLSRLGYGNAEIATICDTSPAVVRTYKSSLKKNRRSRRGQ